MKGAVSGKNSTEFFFIKKCPKIVLKTGKITRMLPNKKNISADRDPSSRQTF
jgi:hypothetical protein